MKMMKKKSKNKWIEIVNQEIREEHIEKTKKANPYLFDSLSDDMAEWMDDIRMGRRTFEDMRKDVK